MRSFSPLVLALAFLSLAACAPARSVKVVTKSAPAPSVAAATHFRLVDVDEQANEVILEPVSLQIVNAEGERTEIIRVSGGDKLILDFQRFATLVEEGGLDTVDLVTGDILAASYGPHGQLMRLTPHRLTSQAPLR